MNSHIAVDLHENIMITTDTCPTVDELLAAVFDYPFLIDVIVQQTLPKLRKYAEDNFDCELKVEMPQAMSTPITDVPRNIPTELIMKNSIPLPTPIIPTTSQEERKPRSTLCVQ